MLTQNNPVKIHFVLKVQPWSLGGQEVPEITKIGVNLLRNVF